VSGGATLSAEGDRLRVSGELDFASVVDLKAEGDCWLNGPAPASCRLDLGGVSRSNSAGIALLLGWLRTAGEAGKSLRLENLPESLRSLAHLAGLDAVVDEATRSG